MLPENSDTQETPREFDWWRLPTLLLWIVFFAAGLAPMEVYYHLRIAGDVVTQDAMTNSHWLIPLGLAGYLYFFTRERCVEAGLEAAPARGRALQIALVALVAFLPAALAHAGEIRAAAAPEQQRMYFAFAACKLVAWAYLLSVLLRYYFLDGYRVYRRMPTVFPSLSSAHMPENGTPDGRDR